MMQTDEKKEVPKCCTDSLSTVVSERSSDETKLNIYIFFKCFKSDFQKLLLHSFVVDISKRQYSIQHLTDSKPLLAKSWNL